jgi:hypothetical protein
MPLGLWPSGFGDHRQRGAYEKAEQESGVKSDLDLVLLSADSLQTIKQGPDADALLSLSCTSTTVA